MMCSLQCDDMLVWLAVMTTAFHTSQAQCQDGSGTYGQHNIIVRGINTTNLIAGRIEMCVDSEWRALCHDGWDSNDARALCGILGFSRSLHCRNSCFGMSNRTRGIRYIECSGQQRTCTGNVYDFSACGQDAGLVCSTVMNVECPLLMRTTPPTWPTTATRASPTASPTEAPTCPTVTCPTTCPNTTSPTVTCPTTCPNTTSPTVTCPTTCPTTTRTHPATNTVEMSTDAATIGSLGGDMVGGAQSAESCDFCPSLAALGGGLGGLCVILALLLVGVVMGWVWSCHRRTRKQERVSTGHPLTSRNHYTTTSISTTTPSVQYSSLGPRDGTSNPPLLPMMS